MGEIERDRKRRKNTEKKRKKAMRIEKRGKHYDVLLRASTLANALTKPI